MINFASCFMISKALGWGDILKMQGQIWPLPHLRPHVLRMPPLRALPYTYYIPTVGSALFTLFTVFGNGRESNGALSE
jgi:hypothetical protein